MQAARVRAPLGLALRRVAPQREHVVDARGAHVVEDLAELLARRPDAAEVGHRLDAVLALDLAHDVERAIARGSASAVGHRGEVGLQAREVVEGTLEVLLPGLRLGGEELEREDGFAVATGEDVVDTHGGK